jgi:hypothetical protein
MQPFVIRQGDYVLSLAHEFGFDADTVWKDPKNADVAKLRDPNILYPGDILYIPDQVDKQPDCKNLTTGAMNPFVSVAPPTPVRITFKDPDLASQPCTIAELPDLTSLATTDKGLLEFTAPVTLNTATVSFTAVPATFSCRVGHLDPIETASGVFQRLQNLGVIDDAQSWDPPDPDLIRSALALLDAMSQTRTDDGSTCPGQSDDDSGNASDGSGATDGSPASTPPAGDAGGGGATTPPTSDSSSAASSAPGDLPVAEQEPPNDMTLYDPSPSDGVQSDGTLDADTAKRLLDSHGY